MVFSPTKRFSPWTAAGSLVAALAVVASTGSGWAASAAATPVSYNDHILPILAENCFHCHGPDSGTRKGKLRLDRAEYATVPRGDHDPAIVPGKPDASPVIERILSKDTEEVMPPPDSHKTLKPAEIALLKRWIAEGAQYQEHWSFLAPVRPAVPITKNQKSKIENPLDAFILARLAQEKLSPARPEEPARLLRRVTLDLTGLPPTPEELAAFVRDPSPAAYARAVDRLLASDAGAEQFARQWLDAVRYADTHGIHIDNFRSIWPYRDWVVNAFRQNMPFDQFTVEQMAGDLLPAATLEQKIASGFNRCLPTTSEGGAIAAEYEAIYAKDLVETMSTVWLGLTTGCASCHDHKFDPVSTKDFYALTAFFRNNTMPAMDGNVSDTRPSLFVPAVADRAEWTRVQVELETVRAAQKARAKAADADFTAWLATAKSLAVPPKDYDTPLHVSLVGPASDSPNGSDAPVAGPYGPATRLDGHPLTLGAPIPLRREQSDSLSLLVRVAEKPSGPLISSWDAGEGGAGWEVFLEEGKIGVRLRGGRADFSARGVAAAALKPGAWHHVVFTFDSGSWSNRSVEVYVDGKAGANAGNINHVPADIVPTAPLVLGARADAPLTGGGVWVQDVRHHRRGFTVAQAKVDSAVIETHAALTAEPAARTPAQTKLLREHFFDAADAPSLALHAQLDGLLATEATLRRRGGITLVMEEKKDSEPFAHILTRGEYSQLGEKVSAATPAVLPPLPAEAPRNRLTLARWLVDAKNPLTARVTVNRTWQHLFGSGLVESAGDFGVTGSRPSHPELLDWLAVDFRESGWDYRRLVKLMVTSATYRQSAVATPALLERDPANRLLARGPRHRLDAEQLRDQALAASGLLVAKLGGRPVRPYQPEGIWEDVAMKESTTRYYRQDSGDNLYRRSLYTLIKRTALAPAMDILNAPNREVSCVRRDRTNTPLQALVTLNDPLFVESSRQLAARALRTAPAFDARLDLVSLRLLGRKFSKPERAVVRRTLDQALATYQREPAAAQKLLAVGESPVDAQLPVPELAAWTLVASQVMNLDEALTK
jgi:mono/diheme cytochrome c family protein/cytochrome c553